MDDELLCKIVGLRTFAANQPIDGAARLEIRIRLSYLPGGREGDRMLSMEL
ncbi:hypothetical protein HX862_07735 [Pseudomonas sp. D5002]|jgi:hypothetical protein|uniref:hypothetical protein n=1 Tax=Pseudomonas sp. D5002 TaxID=2738818 RepID=UPI0015A4B0C6|nr:hypothetical protein [Pseudomonas sp. D5002]NWB07778.1 hypothetical protein [Pseudomonas sp. D5002]